MMPFSVLDLSPITQGSDAAHSFRNTLDLARHAEHAARLRSFEIAAEAFVDVPLDRIA